MKPRIRTYCLIVLLVIIVLPLITSCSPLYVMRAAYEESKILLRRQAISDLLADERLPDNERAKLELVLDVRNYALTLGLSPGESFTLYSKVDKDVLAWVLLGAKKLSFQMHTWWFPIVGNVPYKGFFEKEDAVAAGERLKQEGYEVWIRGTDAMSTLGWFNDPVLSTTLKYPDVQIANTVIHETLHSTLWVPNHVPFNESLANFVGLQGAVGYYQSKVRACVVTNGDCTTLKSDLSKAQYLLDREQSIAQHLARAVTALEKLYQEDRPEEERLAERQKVFSDHMAIVHQQYPELKVLRTVNNAEIMQLKIYLTDFEKFRALFHSLGERWEPFLAKMKEIGEQADADSSVDPFELLDLAGTNPASV